MNVNAILNQLQGLEKLNRNKINEIKIDLIFEEIKIENLTLKQASFLILGMAKVINRRFKYLLEDCKQFLQIKKRERTRRTVNKAITLAKENLSIIADDVYEKEDEEFFKDESLIELDAPAFDIDFGNDLTIEEVRNSALSSSIHPENLTITVKRRKIEDKTTEIEEDEFKRSLKSYAELIKGKPRVLSLGESKIEIPRKILEMFEIQEAKLKILHELNIEDPPEIERDSLIQEREDFDFNSLDNFDDAVGNRSFQEFPNEFEFNAFSSNWDTSTKAVQFYEILKLASDGKLKATQEKLYSEIFCVIEEGNSK